MGRRLTGWSAKLASSDASDVIGFAPDVRAALRDRRAVVAIETAMLAHGLPPAANVAFARRLQTIIRDAGAVPALIGLDKGVIRVGMSDSEAQAVIGARDIPER